MNQEISLETTNKSATVNRPVNYKSSATANQPGTTNKAKALIADFGIVLANRI